MVKLDSLNFKPFELKQKDKERIFLVDMKKAMARHYKNCADFRKIMKDGDFNINKWQKTDELPYISTDLFKEKDLLSAPKKKIIKTIHSSSTFGKPSKIYIDEETRKNQILGLSKILADFLKNEKYHFLVFGNGEKTEEKNTVISSRSAFIGSMLLAAKGVDFLFDKNLKINGDKIKKTIAKINKKDKVAFLGFTRLIYDYLLNNQDEIKKYFSRARLKEAKIFHGGGWKKLSGQGITKEKFANLLKKTGFAEDKIIDVYALSEHIGIIYPDCEYGRKHVPTYSEIIIRDINTLEPLGNDKKGFIQFLSPLPISFPGCSILTDDLGEIKGVDDCPCGRKGKNFIFKERRQTTELRGCGDALNA